MTVQKETPVVEYTGNNVTTVFSFDWSSGDPGDNYVTVDGEDQIEGTTWELENYDPENGGEVVFYEPPTTDQSIQIFRRTPITQEVSYDDGEPFQAETHERQLDKDTRILQEIDAGVGSAFGAGVNLRADQQEEQTVIVNDAGTDATILPWKTDGTESGIFLGEVLTAGQTSPVVDDPTDKEEGYMWLKLGTPNWVGGDPTIVTRTTELWVESRQTTPRAEIAWHGDSGNVGWGYDQFNRTQPPIWQEQAVVRPAGFAAGKYWVKMDEVNGTFQGSATGTWLDAATAYSWFTDGNNEVIGIFSIAPDDGAGSPDPNYTLSRNVRLTCEVI